MSELFAITEYCTVHNIDPSFIYSLQREGLISITTNEDNNFVEEEELHRLEIYTRMYTSLGINPEGIDAISHLLEKLRTMQEELNALKNRLSLYEHGS